MSTRRALRWLLPIALLGVGCGPSVEQIGASCLAQLVLCDVMLALMLVPYVRFWRRLRPELTPSWGPFWVVSAMHLAIALFAGAGADGRVYTNLELVGIATSVMMPFYVSLSLLAIRLTFIRRLHTAFWLAPAAVSLLMLAPALMLRAGHDEGMLAVAVWFWGGIGLLPLVFIGLIVELVRKLGAPDQAEVAPPPI